MSRDRFQTPIGVLHLAILDTGFMGSPSHGHKDPP